jgi:OOP family OmpA-OmpF porin
VALAGACASAEPDPATDAADKAERAEPPVQIPMSGGQLMLPAPIQFAGAGQLTLHRDSEQCLHMVKVWLDGHPEVTTLRIEVHSDVADPAEAQRLSERRALAVASRLVELGADCKRLLPTGFGSTKPIADPSTPDGRSKNRRVELRPAAMRGKAIAGLPLDGGGRVAGDPCAK